MVNFVQSVKSAFIFVFTVDDCVYQVRTIPADCSELE
jgi:hypothetical protein